MEPLKGDVYALDSRINAKELTKESDSIWLLDFWKNKNGTRRMQLANRKEFKPT